MIIKDKNEFANYVKKLKFRYAKTYAHKAPHEYSVGNDNTIELEIIRALNKYIQENYDEIELFWNKEYFVLFVEKHKYWNIGDCETTTLLNRNWDYKNEDGTINKSITESYLGS